MTDSFTQVFEVNGHDYYEQHANWEALKKTLVWRGKWPHAYVWKTPDGIAKVTGEYDRVVDPQTGRDITRHVKFTYNGPEDNGLLFALRVLWEDKQPSVKARKKELRAKWEYKISLEEQRGAPDGYLNAMKRKASEELAAIR